MRAQRVVAEDSVLVRAPVGLVYRAVTDVAAWPTWWPALAVAPAGRTQGAPDAVADDPADGAIDRWRLVIGRPPGRSRLSAAASGWRHDVGFRLALDGDLVGGAEWWLEPSRGATLVHHVLDLEAIGGRDLRRIARLRRALRRGLWGLQGRCEAAVLLALAAAPSPVRDVPVARERGR